ncbi:MAG: c-type cytochrome [Giesbergeria sp.]
MSFLPDLSLLYQFASAAAILALVPAFAIAGNAQASPDTERQQVLVQMVRQDCGSCHGLRLTGGLGPALTAAALTGKPVESLAATIYGGRPGTPMAPWNAMLSESEARWIAEQLQSGFPELPKAHP